MCNQIFQNVKFIKIKANIIKNKIKLKEKNNFDFMYLC